MAMDWLTKLQPLVGAQVHVGVLVLQLDLPAAKSACCTFRNVQNNLCKFSSAADKTWLVRCMLVHVDVLVLQLACAGQWQQGRQTFQRRDCQQGAN
jgi:hypothetical protein